MIEKRQRNFIIFFLKIFLTDESSFRQLFLDASVTFAFRIQTYDVTTLLVYTVKFEIHLNVLHSITHTFSNAHFTYCISHTQLQIVSNRERGSLHTENIFHS